MMTITESDFSSPLAELTPILYDRWLIGEYDPSALRALIYQHDILEPIARLLLSRGIGAKEVSEFMWPTLRQLLPNPSHFLDMDKAIKLVCECLVSGCALGVLGDYDVDGACSTALLVRYCQQLGTKVHFYIPDRMTEGYGPSNQAMDFFIEKGCTLIVIVDCGTMAFDPISYGKSKGLNIVVIDHHLSIDQLPIADALVNPNRFDDPSSYTYLCAAGMCFMFLVGLQAYLRDHHIASQEGWILPDLIQFLDVVALATICDVVPLKGINRAFVLQGLKVVSKRQHPGFAALIDSAELKDPLSAYHLGFILGPRINAGGRVGKSRLGAELLTAQDYVLASQYAQTLAGYNEERKQLEQVMLEEAMLQAEQQIAQEKEVPYLIVYSHQWHQGVIGIIAGRLKDRFGKPTFSISFDKEGIGKGSARSIHGINIGGTIVLAKQHGYLREGGGHAMAAGFSIHYDQLEELKRFLKESWHEKTDAFTQAKSLICDGAMTLASISDDFMNQLQWIEPFGSENPEPKFAFLDVVITQVDLMKERHVRCYIKDARLGSKSFKAMAFNVMTSPLGDALISAKGKQVHLIASIKRNHWMGRITNELTIIDLAFC
jgi:single-stranded-DNA-specific exonuclease